MSQQVQSLKVHLSIVKQSPTDKIEEDFYNFMIKAKDQLGQISYLMAQFYYEYANFILQKIQSTADIFGDKAIPKNVHQEQEQQLQNIPEDLSEDSSQINQNSQKNCQQHHEEENQELNEYLAIAEGGAEHPNAADQHEVEQDQPEDDKDICACNLELAVRLYQEQLERIRDGSSSTPINQVLDGLRRARTRLGDLYMIDENYTKCVEYYQLVISSESEREGFKCNRLISELYYLIGNCYLYQNKTDCEAKAINQFVKSTHILLGYLSITLGYDVQPFQVPSEKKVKVQRFHYMSLPGDSEEVKEIKDVLSCLLDKIEDTQGQMAGKEIYQAEKRKLQQQKKLSQFKPVTDSTKVVNLGSFGNRKRKPEDLQLSSFLKENMEMNAAPHQAPTQKRKEEDHEGNAQKRGTAQ